MSIFGAVKTQKQLEIGGVYKGVIKSFIPEPVLPSLKYPNGRVHMKLVVELDVDGSKKIEVVTLYDAFVERVQKGADGAVIKSFTQMSNLLDIGTIAGNFKEGTDADEVEAWLKTNPINFVYSANADPQYPPQLKPVRTYSVEIPQEIPEVRAPKKKK